MASTKKLVRKRLKRFTTIGSAIDLLRNKRIAFLDPEKWDDRNDAEFMRLYKGKAKCESLKALCCTQSPETYHHWKVFTHSTDGCFIEFEKKPLIDSVRTDERYRASGMEYIGLDEIELCDYQYTSLPFLKRAGFKPEEEFRIIYTGECDEEVHFMDIDLGWINRIVLNPWLPPSIAASIKDTFWEISGKTDLKITASKLTNSQTWVRWGRSISRQRS